MPAKKPEAKKPAPKATVEDRSFAAPKTSTADDIHSIYILIAKLEASMAELTAACNAAVQALASLPAEAVQAESRGTCPACAAELTAENSSKTPSGKVVHTSCKVRPLGGGPSPAEAKAEAKPEKVTLEALRVALQGYVERNGREAAEALMAEAGYARVSDIPEDDRADALEAFGG